MALSLQMRTNIRCRVCTYEAFDMIGDSAKTLPIKDYLNTPQKPARLKVEFLVAGCASPVEQG
jgi:hypothetical protein